MRTFLASVQDDTGLNRAAKIVGFQAPETVPLRRRLQDIEGILQHHPRP